MSSAIINEENTVKYLAKHEKKINRRGKITSFSCAFCNGMAAHFIPNSGAKIFCTTCNKKYTLIDIVRKFDEPLSDKNDEEIVDYLSEMFGIPIQQKGETEGLLKLYEALGFSLVALSTFGDGKRPIEADWCGCEHKDIKEWEDWVFSKKLNVGIRTGDISGITVIDIDDKECVPECLKGLNTLISETAKGFHYIFKYEKAFINKNLRFSKKNPVPIEVLSNGRQIVSPPSITNGFKRKWIDLSNIIEMPEAVKEWLKQYYNQENIDPIDKQQSGDLPKQAVVLGSGRRSFLIHLGGILKSDLSVKQCAKVLELIDCKFFKPRLSSSGLKNVLSSLEKYIGYDEKDVAGKVYQHLLLVEFANSKEIAESLHERKDIVEKALAYLILNEVAYKRGRNYFPIIKTKWEDKLLDDSSYLPFKVPYFEDVAKLAWQDHIILGAQPKVGKSTISINIIKQLVEQGVCPYYYSSESGSRFKKIALQLGLRDGEFKYTNFYNPDTLVFEKDSVCIVDWLLFKDYASADKVMESIKNKVIQANCFAIIITQLKEDGNWYSRNMVKFFPSMAARYLYDSDNGETGFFQLDNIREPKNQIKEWKVPCRYDFETKRLVEITPSDISNDSVNLQDNQYSFG